MKIFLMITSSGSYEDYYEEIKGAYLSKENCQKAILEYNDELHYKQTMVQVIKEISLEVGEELWDKFQGSDVFIYESQEFIDIVRARIQDLPYDVSDKDITDIAYDSYDIFEEDDARMRAIEVLDIQQ